MKAPRLATLTTGRGGSWEEVIHPTEVDGVWKVSCIECGGAGWFWKDKAMTDGLVCTACKGQRRCYVAC
jgi:hypothetical protein